ncbi:hypothetical protein A4A49_51574, partial [Nicotiana attenuata]
MARQRKKSTTKATNTEQTEKLDEEDQRIVTPETGIQQNLESAQLFHWMKGMGSAPTIMHGHELRESVEKTTIQAPTIASIALTPTDLAENETEMAMAARKLTFSTGIEDTKPTLAVVVQGNRSSQQGLKLNYYPPTVKDGRKIVRLNMIVVEEQTRRWQTSLIGYVLGGTPQFKEMLGFVYGVWQFVSTPQVLMHEEGYFVFKFDCDEDRDLVMQNGPYTFNNRPMLLKNWEADFKMSKELMTNVPVWVT